MRALSESELNNLRYSTLGRPIENQGMPRFKTHAASPAEPHVT